MATALIRTICSPALYANNSDLEDYKKSYQVTYEYKGADPEDKGSWGAYVAYRKLGGFASPFPTSDGAMWDTKGVEVGTDYTLFKNVVLSAKIFPRQGDLCRTDG